MFGIFDSHNSEMMFKDLYQQHFSTRLILLNQKEFMLLNNNIGFLITDTLKTAKYKSHSQPTSTF